MRKMAYSTLFALLLLAFVYTTGCKSPYNPEALKPNRIQGGTDVPPRTPGNRTDSIALELTYPVGASPKVFATGWVFGAKCVLNPGTQEQQDISNQVRWLGDAVFAPNIGSLSRPTFNKIGENVILLEITVSGKTVREQYTISTVTTTGYACLGDQAQCPAPV
jgi:hypothetical protein